MYFMNLVTLWAGWQRASQEIAEAALTCAALACLVPAACLGSQCLLPARVSQSHSGGVSALCIHPGLLRGLEG